METLIEILKKETKSLKDQYIEKTKEWSKKHFESVMAKQSWKEVDWCKYFGLTPELVNKGTHSEFLSFPKGFYNTRNAREYSKFREEAYKLSTMGLEKYVDKEVLMAEKHYESSVIKLANRIEKKGLNIHNLTTVTSHIGVNINTTLTDGEKTVKAFTIIAEGAVQRPHYRYLVK